MDEHRSELREPESGLRRPGGRRPLGPRLVWLVILALAVGLAAWLVLRPPASQQARTGRFANGGAPMAVVTAAATPGDMPVWLNALGTVTPLATVTVRTQINGQLLQIAFQEGEEVNKGDFLAQIDPRPYQAALDQLEGQLHKDQALLTNAKLDLARFQKLVAQNSIAVQQRDTQLSLVQQYEGTVKSDEAQVENARLNLAYCRIVAPISGRIGLRQVDQGNYVQVSDPNGIAVITQLRPISVIFTVPEDNLPAIQKRLNAGASLEVDAWDRAMATKLATGKLTTVDNQIDTSTGTVKLRAQFDNADGLLFPNQFVNTRLLVDTIHDAVIVPAAAIQRGAPGTFVYLVKGDSTVTVRPVKLGPGDGDRVAIRDGLAAGDAVVVDGADKLRDGAKVAVGDGTGQAQPTPAAAPATGQRENRRRQQGGTP